MGSIPVAGAKIPLPSWAEGFWYPPELRISANVVKRNWVRISRPKIDKLACQA